MPPIIASRLPEKYARELYSPRMSKSKLYYRELIS